MTDPFMATAAQRRVALIVVAVAGFILFRHLGLHADTDIDFNARYMIDIIENRRPPAVFLFYLLVGIVTWFSTDFGTIINGMAAVMGVSLAAKLAITWWMLRDASVRFAGPLAIGMLLLFSFPIPGELWFANGFPPNLWHSATSTAMMPFALLLFRRTARYVEDPASTGIGLILLWVLLNVLTKPALILCIVPGFPLMVLWRHGFGRAFAWSIVTSFGAGVCLLLQASIIYLDPEYDRIAEAGQATIRLGWFHPWSLYSGNIALSILNALLLPILALVFYGRRLWRHADLRFAWILMVIGVAIYAFVYETGTRETDGNFGWQATVCSYLLHLVTLRAWLRVRDAGGPSRWRDRVLIAVFVAQVVCGAAYVARLVATGKFL